VESELTRRAGGGQVAGEMPLEQFAGAYLPALGMDAPAPAPAPPPGHAAPATGREATAASAAGAAASLARSDGVAPHARPPGGAPAAGPSPPTQLGAGALGAPGGPAGGAGAGAADEPDQAAALEAEARRWDLAREQLAHGEPPPAACGAASPDPNPGSDPASAAGSAREERGAAARGAGGAAGPKPEQARGDGLRPDDLRSASSLARGAAAGGGRAAAASTTAAALGAMQARLGAGGDACGLAKCNAGTMPQFCILCFCAPYVRPAVAHMHSQVSFRIGWPLRPTCAQCSALGRPTGAAGGVAGARAHADAARRRRGRLRRGPRARPETRGR
jgi:hypothetical protein